MRIFRPSESVLSIEPQVIEANSNLFNQCSLEFDKEYLVYYMTHYEGHMHFGVTDEHNFLTSYRAELFSVSDNRLSKYWRLQTHLHDYPPNACQVIIAYPEMAEDYDHYCKVLEYDLEAATIFHKYKMKMDVEFADPGVSLSANKANDGWLLCGHCVEGWQASSDDEMVICPACETVQRNPLSQQA